MPAPINPVFLDFGKAGGTAQEKHLVNAFSRHARILLNASPGWQDWNKMAILHLKDALIKSTSISASRTHIAFVMISSLKSSENTAFCVVGVVKRPSGGIEEHAGCVIPHYVGPTTLLRHSLPAHPSLPLIFADLIKASLTIPKTLSDDPEPPL